MTDHSSPGALAAVLADLVVLHRNRQNMMGVRLRVEGSARARVRSSLGFSPLAPEAERKRIVARTGLVEDLIAKEWQLSRLKLQAGARAATLRRQIDALRADLGPEPRYNDCAILLNATHLAVLPFEQEEKKLEKAMLDALRATPAWDWCQAIPGLAAGISVATVVGEIGLGFNGNGLADFPSRQHVWKRLGLAVIGGRGQGNPGPKATAADWTAHAYNPRRRSLSFVNLALPVKMNGGAEPYITHYRAVKARLVATNEAGGYAERAAEEVQRAKAAGKPPVKANLEGRLTPGHIDRRATRAMEKRIVADLWRAWNAAVRR